MTFGILQLAAMVVALEAGPQSGPAASPSLAGDWVLAGGKATGRLRISNDGKEATLSFHAANGDGEGDGDGTVEERFRVSGTLGAALTLEPAAAAKKRATADSHVLPARARLLPVSPTVALWWQPHRQALFAYRVRAVPVAFLGRYTIDKGSEELRSIEVTADAIAQRGTDDDDAERIPIVAVTDIGEKSVRLMLARGEALRIELAGPRAILGKEIPADPDTIVEGRFVPAAKNPDRAVAPAKSRPPGEDLPSTLIGPFRVSSLAKNEEQALTISSAEWTFRPLGGMSGGAGWTNVTGNLSPGAMRVTIGGSGSRSSFNLRSLGNDLWLLEEDGRVSVIYRPDEPPPWAPAVGLADDVRRLCRELEPAGPRLDDGAVKAAFERAGRGARSDVMRSLVEALVSVPTELRAAVLARGLVDAGEPMPACPGLRALPNQRRPEASDE